VSESFFPHEHGDSLLLAQSREGIHHNLLALRGFDGRMRVARLIGHRSIPGANFQKAF